MVKLSLDQVLLKARSHVKRNEIAEAQELYQKALYAFPKNKSVKQEFENLNKPKHIDYINSPPQQIVDELVNLYNQGKLAVVAEKAQSLTKEYPFVFILWNILGASSAQIGLLDDAIEAYKKSILIEPNSPLIYNNMGVVFKDQNNLDEATQAYKKSIELNPNNAEAFNNLGIVLFKQNKQREAIEVYKKAISLKPEYVEAYVNMGNVFKNQGKIDQAFALYNKALLLRPNYAELYNNIGVVLKEQGKLEEAIKAFNKALSIKPNYADAYNNMGIVFKNLGKLDKAFEIYNKVLLIEPNYAEAYSNIGNILRDQGKFKEAIKAHKKCISIKPNHAEAYNNIGIAMKDQGFIEEAIIYYNKAISLKPNYAEAYNNIGVAHKHQDNIEQAIICYKKALSLRPDYAETYNNLGNTLKDQGFIEKAFIAYNKALELKPNYAEVYNNLGVALEEQCKFEEAKKAFNKAISLNPNYAEAYNNMGNILKIQSKIVEAIEYYEKALLIKPDYEIARAQKLHQLSHICDWDNIEEDKNLLPSLGTKTKFIPPFSILSIEDEPNRHRIRSEIYSKAKHPQKQIKLPEIPLKSPRCIRIGYFSSDFREHPVGYSIAKVLELHNRNEFEVFGYSLFGNAKSKLRQRIERSFDCFVDMKGITDKNAALRARQDKIDIAIDLTGYTTNNRSGIFAYRTAPIQINYLGYPGTMGCEFMDYIIADQNLIPTDSQSFYSEKPIYLPHHFQAQDDTILIPSYTPSRYELGLPEKGFIFCAINNNYKITRTEFYIWMRLLNKVKGSVLWLLGSNNQSKLNLLNEAQSCGIEPKRLVFANFTTHEKYLAQFRLADLFLDTFNCNAGVTASNALWAGLPVLTKSGKSFASRMAASLLHSLGLSKLITTTEEDYEKLALELSQDSKLMLKLKEELIANKISKPLFNSKLFVKHLENGYHQAYKNYFDGNKPQTIFVTN